MSDETIVENNTEDQSMEQTTQDSGRDEGASRGKGQQSAVRFFHVASQALVQSISANSLLQSREHVQSACCQSLLTNFCRKTF